MPLHLASSGMFDICSQRERHHLCPMVSMVALTPWVWGSAGCCGAPVSCLLMGGGLHGIVTTLYLKGLCILRDIVQWLLLFLLSFIEYFFFFLVFFVMLFDFTLAVVFVCFNNVITVLFVVPLFSRHCCIPLYLESKVSQVQNASSEMPHSCQKFLSESWRNLENSRFTIQYGSPLYQLEIETVHYTVYWLLGLFYVIKSMYRQYCAMSTSAYIVFVLSCANYYELCCYMYVLAKV